GGGEGRGVGGFSPHRRPARRRGDPGARRRRLAAARIRSGRVRRRRGDAILRRRGDALSRAGGSMKPGVVDEAKAKAREYFRTRGTLAAAASIRERTAAASGTPRASREPISAATAARVGIPGEWTIQEIVDHLVETHRPGLDELWCLFAGRRPPGEPIPAALQSKAPLHRP